MDGADMVEGADPPHRSPLAFPPCACGAPGCPDRRKRDGDDGDGNGGDSETLATLRARIRELNEERRRARWLRSGPQ